MVEELDFATYLMLGNPFRIYLRSLFYTCVSLSKPLFFIPRSHAIIQLKILKERVGNDNPSSRMASPSSYGMKTPDFYFSDDEESGHDSFSGSMVSDEFSRYNVLKKEGASVQF